MAIVIRAAPLEVVRELRHAVLRPHQPAAALTYEHDRDGDALHVAAFEGRRALAVASITREPPPGGDDASAWRVRGMATLPNHRGRGFGGELLERCVAHAVEHGASFVWLNARLRATPFYERHGFVVWGGVFELADIGPHRELRRDVAAGPPAVG